jgi:hypothetical protein
MIRRYFLFGLITLLFSVSIYAQYEQTGGFARLRGMGNNPYVVDPYFMTTNPAWGGYYQNFLLGDLGSTAGPWAPGGVGQFILGNFHVGGGLSLGAMVTRNDFGGFSIGRLDPGTVIYTGTGTPTVSPLSNLVPGVTALNNNLELFGSYKSGNTSFGLGVAYASTSNEFNPPTGNGSVASASQFGVNAGLVTKLTGSILLDLGASLMMPSATLEPPTGSKIDFSQTFILANVRLFWDISSKLSFVPAIVFATSSGSADTFDVDLASTTLISVGLGLNYHVGDFTLAGGPGFATASITFNPDTLGMISAPHPELSWSAMIFPIWNLGVEWNLTDWFVGRFGYVYSTQSITREDGTTGNITEQIFTTFFGQQGATLGVGFRLGNFSLDATVNEDVLRQGLNNLGGNGPGAATFAYLSLAYSIP